MKFAYADPVYYKQSHHYPDHPESYLWDDLQTHHNLILRLVEEYPDGWALSCSAPSLRLLLPVVPERARIGVWCKTFSAFKRGVRPAYAWEPVIWCGGRNPPEHPHPPPPKGGKQTTPKDFHETWVETPGLLCPITLRKGLTGAKPEAFCHWVLDLLGFQPGDLVDDLYPGTNVMGDVVLQRQAANRRSRHMKGQADAC